MVPEKQESTIRYAWRSDSSSNSAPTSSSRMRFAYLGTPPAVEASRASWGASASSRPSGSSPSPVGLLHAVAREVEQGARARTGARHQPVPDPGQNALARRLRVGQHADPLGVEPEVPGQQVAHVVRVVHRALQIGDVGVEIPVDADQQGPVAARRPVGVCGGRSFGRGCLRPPRAAGRDELPPRRIVHPLREGPGAGVHPILAGARAALPPAHDPDLHPLVPVAHHQRSAAVSPAGVLSALTKPGADRAMVDRRIGLIPVGVEAGPLADQRDLHLQQAGGELARVLNPPTGHRGRGVRRREPPGPFGVRQLDRFNACRLGERQQRDVVLKRPGLLVLLMHMDGPDPDPPRVLGMAVVVADQHLDLVRGERIAVLHHAMRGGEHPPRADHRAAAQGLPGEVERHLPGPLAGLGLHAADDARVLPGAGRRLVRLCRRPAGQQRPHGQGADDGGRERRCFDALHGFASLLGLVAVCRAAVGLCKPFREGSTTTGW